METVEPRPATAADPREKRNRASVAAPKRSANGTWGFVMDRGPGYSNGKWRERRQARRGGFATRREAVAAMRKISAEIESGTDSDPSRESLRVYLERWLTDTMPQQVRESTALSYSAMMRTHVIPNLGESQLRKLSAPMLDTLYRQLSEPGANRRSPDKGLSRRTIRYVHTILRGALDDAVRVGLIARNPADNATPPRPGARSSGERIKAWSGEDLARFLHLAERDDDRYLPLWRLLSSTGMRRGEALGLQWADIDLDGSTVTIVRSITTASGQVFIGEPKTRSGARTIGLDRRTVEVLRGLRRRTAEERMLLGQGAIPADGWVFAELDGEHLEPLSVTHRFVQQCRRHELPHISLHGLRHTWATLALRGGVHPRIVQERLGHADIGTTLGTYSHVTASMDADAAQSVADSFDSCDTPVLSEPVALVVGR